MSHRVMIMSFNENALSNKTLHNRRNGGNLLKGCTFFKRNSFPERSTFSKHRVIRSVNDFHKFKDGLQPPVVRCQSVYGAIVAT